MLVSLLAIFRNEKAPCSSSPFLSENFYKPWERRKLSEEGLLPCRPPRTLIENKNRQLFREINVPLEPTNLSIALDAYGEKRLFNLRSNRFMKYPLAQEFFYFPKARALPNEHNFCFMNAVLQVLVFLPPFAQLAISVGRHIPEAVMKESTIAIMGNWFREYWAPNPADTPLAHPKLPLHAKKSFNGDSQADALEYLQQILETVDKELCIIEENLPSYPKSQKDAKLAAVEERKHAVIRTSAERISISSLEVKRSFLLSSIFGGMTESVRTTPFQQEIVLEKFFMLSLILHKKKVCHIEDVLRHTFCGDSSSASSEKKYIIELPEVLILHVSRLERTSAGIAKITSKLVFGPKMIVPKEICSPRLEREAQREYKLVSMIAHRGEDEAGHYVTYLYNPRKSLSPLKTPNAAVPRSCKLDTTVGANDIRYVHPPVCHRPLGGFSKGCAGFGQTRKPFTVPHLDITHDFEHDIKNEDFLLCDDEKRKEVDEETMLKDTAYLIVYQKAHT